MKAQILDIKKENDNICYMVKANLHEFITDLPDDYKDYDVQRGIVKNAYLDTIIDTVLEKKHIPPIVLILDGKYEIEKTSIDIGSYKILDGLQRTYRLKIIWDTIDFFYNIRDKDSDLGAFSRYKLSRNYSKKLRDIDSESSILYKLIQKWDKERDYDFEGCFKNNEQWFEAWVGLSPEDEVEKMLLLNAGHKPVKTQHQLELLFRNLIPVLNKAESEKFDLIREKQQSSILYSKNRKQGQFHFSHIISSLISLKRGEPLTANTQVIHQIQSKDFEVEEYKNFFKVEFVKKFIKFLLKIDRILYKEFDDIGLKWIGREVALVGLFSAIGKVTNQSNKSEIEIFDQFINILDNNKKILNIGNFEKVRNSLDLAKVNIGQINKQSVYKAILDLLTRNTNDIIVWENYFKGN